jgi:hypothetical protein
MKEFFPIFNKQNLLYIREEKEGCFTIIPKLHPETREILINSTSMEILNLCNGNNTLEKIIEKMNEEYPNVERNRIEIDVYKTISSFSRLGIIEWKGENPFLDRKETPLNEEFSMVIAQENNIREIESFLKSFLNTPFLNREKNFFYKSPLLIPQEYEELSLRQKMFAYTEEFFLLLKENKIEGIIAIEIPIYPPKLTSALLKLIFSPKLYFKDFVRYAHDNFAFLSVKEVTKIKILEPLENPFDKEFKEVLYEEGYKEEGLLRDEAGFGKDIRILSIVYKKDFIESIKAKRKKIL